jgi:maleate isomerase
MADHRINADRRGYRIKFGVLGPSTNTTVQPDFDDMRPAGVTNHYSRIIVDNAQAISNETFMAGVSDIDDNTIQAVRSVLSAAPDYLVMGMSAVTFLGGAQGSLDWSAKIKAASGLDISTGAQSLIAAFQAYGGIKRVGLLSPYYPAANDHVMRFFSDHGIETPRDISLKCLSWRAIAEVTDETLRESFRTLDGDDVDALVQVGTNLSAVRFAAAAELWLGKPVIAINTATYWHALRANGIADKVYGFGRLLEEF